MNRMLSWMVGLSVALAPAACGWALETLQWKWTQTLTGANAYYLNNNTDNGGVLVGQISFGGRWIDRDGTELDSLATTGLLPNGGAKSLLRLGDYYYITNQDGGIGRFDATGTDAWSGTSWAPDPPPSAVDPGGTAPESIVTDGTWLFANDDGSRDHIHAYSVVNAAANFILTEEWDAALPDGHRVRGLSYHPGSGYLYMHNGGDSAGTTLYAIDASDGTVTSMGTHAGEPLVYQVLRRGDELLVFGTSDMLSVYELTSDTTIGGLKQQIDLGLGDIYGAAIINDYLFVASAGSKLSAFQLVPEPGSMVLMALGIGGLLLASCRRRLLRRQTLAR